MTSGILATARIEANIARRNRWILIAVLLMVVFSLVLSAAGSAPRGELGADRLSVVVASLTSLCVYLVPLMALLLAFDAIAGELERGTLPLLLTYPVARWEVLAGKLLAHVTILTIALIAGFAAAAVMAIWSDPEAVAGLWALWRLTWTSVLLGATFLGIGYAVSALSRRVSGAAGIAIGVWLGLVVLYDLALLAAIVADEGGFFTTKVFPVALLANPADAFRLFNLSAAGAGNAAYGVSGASGSIPQWQSLGAVVVWPVLAQVVAVATFRRVQV